MKTSIEQILTKELVGKQILVYELYSKQDNHTIRSSIRKSLVLDYMDAGCYYATIVGVSLGIALGEDCATVLVDLDIGDWVEISFNQLLDLKEKED